MTTNQSHLRPVPTSPYLQADDPAVLRGVQMRIEGKDWLTIARALGYDGPHRVMTTINRMIEKIQADLDAHEEALRQTELARLDALQAIAWEQAKNGSIKAIDVCRAIISDRARIAGLNRPQKIKINSEALPTPDQLQAWKARLAEQIAAKRAEIESA